MLATIAAPARGEITYLDSFGSEGVGPGQFSSAGGAAGGEGTDGIKGIAVNNTTGDVYVTDRGLSRVTQFTAAGDYIRSFGSFQQPQGIAVDNSDGPAAGSVYVQDAGNNRVQRFTADGQFVLTWGKGVNQTTGGNICTAASGDVCKGGTQSRTPASEAGVFAGWTTGPAAHIHVRPNIAVDGSGYVYVAEIASVPYPRVQKFDFNGAFVAQIAPPNTVAGGGTGISNSLGITGEQRTVAANAAGSVYVVDGSNQFVPGVKTFSPSSFSSSGLSATYGEMIAFKQDPRLLAVDPTNQYLYTFAAVSATVGCTPDMFSGFYIEQYHPDGERVDCTRLLPPSPSITNTKAIAISASHKLYVAVGSEVHIFATPAPEAPEVGIQRATAITTKTAIVEAPLSGNLSPTTVHVEYGPAGPCSSHSCASTAETNAITASVPPKTASVPIDGLQPGTTYHYRLVATNDEGVDEGADRTFATFPAPAFDPSCENNLARQQTGASFLLGCRAYELVSAEDTGGYNVESDLVFGQTPLPAYPQAKDKALYAVNNGGIPGAGKPTNRGPDPYIATRDPDTRRWSTKYVGVPADAPSDAPFSSTLAGAEAGLTTLAFGGPEICDPCFSGGGGGLPLRMPDGSLIQGMAGSIPVADPEPAGEIRKPLSADGNHFVFGSEQQFEVAGNPEDGSVTIYDRDLDTGTTQVVSTLPDGSTIANGDDVAQLDVSSDGNRILIGRRVFTDVEGNDYFDLYMHVGSSPNSIEVADTPNGVLYNGMTNDGTKVFFTTADQIGSETDTSVDFFRADVNGTAILTRLSAGSGTTGDTDVCDPVRYGINFHWNTVGTDQTCDAKAIAGGTGIAKGSGAVYFLSPELLDGVSNGVEDAPNLYRVEPGGSAQFVKTMESELDVTGATEKGMHYSHNLGSFTNATAVAPAPNGDVYVYDIGDNPPRVERYSPTGQLVDVIDGSETPNGFFKAESERPRQIAVDPSSGDLYVTDNNNSLGTKYGFHRYDDEGVYLNSSVPLNASGGFAVDPVSHNIFVGNVEIASYVLRPDGTVARTFSSGLQLEVDTAILSFALNAEGNLYVGKKDRIDLRSGAGILAGPDMAPPSTHLLRSVAALPSVVGEPVRQLTVDLATGDLYVNDRNELLRFTADDEKVAAPKGFDLANSAGIAFDTPNRRLYVADRGTVRVYVERFPPDERAIDNPVVVAATNDPETPHPESFQVTDSGAIATFLSARLPGAFEHASSYQAIRHDAVADQQQCVSCSPTEVLPTNDAGLASRGLSVLEDGRVFFTTAEPLVLRDTNKKKDAYEWKDGNVELISTGTSAFDSGLLSASADGTNVFFFTRETLVDEDRNGNLMKLYTAREDGGSFVFPPPPPCAASDECRGAGSPVAGPVSINTVSETDGNHPVAVKGKRCRKGFVKRRGRCVRRTQAKKQAKRRNKARRQHR